jgi:hypothetical protein
LEVTESDLNHYGIIAYCERVADGKRQEMMDMMAGKDRLGAVGDEWGEWLASGRG